jgi:hypothetical protein
MTLHGINIVPHPLALTTKCIVARHPTPKRRRKWTVKRITVPGCYQIGNTFYMHPQLVQKLKDAA